MSGFIANKEISSVQILDKSHKISTGNFELIQENKEKLEYVEIKTTYKNGVQEVQKYQVKQVNPNELTSKEIVARPTLGKMFFQGKNEIIELEKTSLQVSEKDLKENKFISVSALTSREVMPISPEMVNVTSAFQAYRYLPHGNHFINPVKISIGYDPNKIPNGYTTNDIQTFYFDEDQKTWLALEKDSIDVKNNKIISKTNHFTDFINGVIQVPESPETGNYTPTTLSGIKAADPTLGVVSIAPPTPNNMGSVNTSFPLKIPAGRSGMQPSLQLSYSSDSSNGWMGFGWNIGVPSVSIDTGWGVPRYDSSKETEIYTIAGEQLTFLDGTNYVLPHRDGGLDKPRTADRQFFPRIEGAYNKIIRKGNSPKDYYWEITAKDGTKSIYGANENTVLKDDSGNIGHWALWKTIDTNGNFVEYKYFNTNYTGSPGSGARQLYIQKIEYTKSEKDANLKLYTIDFIRNTETVSPPIKYPYTKKDVQINARLGFVQVNADALSEIRISTNAATDTPAGLIRKYAFKYKEGPFSKTLLEEIAEYDETDQLFYSNKMQYEDFTKGGTEIFEDTPREWTVPTDGIENPDLTIDKKFSILSGTKSNTTGFSFGVAVGLGVNMANFKRKTIGAHGGYSSGDAENRITLIDIDGDGLPDKVYKKGSQIFFRRNNLAINGTYTFDSQEKIVNGISDLGSSSSSTWNAGVSGNYDFSKYAIAVGLGIDYSNTTQTIKSYFKDFNGDGLVDFATNGRVLFNNVTDDTAGYKIPNFRNNTSATPLPIFGGSFGTITIDADDKKDADEAIKKNPLHDVVRTWVAPKSGTISVNHTYTYVNSNCTEECDTLDGVKFSFQVRNSTPIWNDIIKPTDAILTKTVNNASINVSKGDKLYFRISSIQDGRLDLVSWNPVIIYSTPTTPSLDANNLSLNAYGSETDFLVSSESPIFIPLTGNINIEIKGQKPILSDDITIKVLLKNEDGTLVSELISQKYIGNTNLAINLNKIVSVTERQNLFIRVESDTQIDWTKLDITPKITVTPTTGSPQDLPAEVYFTMYNQSVGNAQRYTILATDVNKNITVKTIINQTPFPTAYANSKFTLSAKLDGKLLAKTNYTINSLGVPIEDITSKINYTVLSTDVSKNILLEVTTPSIEQAFINYLNNTVTNNLVSQIINKPATINCTTSLTCERVHGGNLRVTNGVITTFGPNDKLNLKFTPSTYTNSATLVLNGISYTVNNNNTTYNLVLNNGVNNYTLTYNNTRADNSWAQFDIENGVTETSLLTTAQQKWNNVNSKLQDPIFGTLYRGWGSFIVHGDKINKETAGKIDETKLKPSDKYDPNIPFTEPDANSSTNGFSMEDEYFVMMQHSFYKKQWIGPDKDNYIAKYQLRTSRLGEDNIAQYTTPPKPAPNLGSILFLNRFSVKL